MTQSDDDERAPAERVVDTAPVLATFKVAVERELRRHIAARNPVAVWRDGRVVWIGPDELAAELRARREGNE